MSAYWKVGDRAVCVERFEGIYTATLEPYSGDRPKVGTIYLVTAVGPIEDGSIGILLANLPEDGYWRASKFRKIVPACDRVSITNHNTQDA